MRNKSILFITLLVAVFTFMGAPAVRADVFVLEDGRSLVGEIVEETEDMVRIKTESGIIVPLERWQIVRISTKAELQKEYKAQAGKIRKDDVNAHMDLAKWCMKHGLKEEQAHELREVLRLSPDHKEAKTLLAVLEGKGLDLGEKKKRTPKKKEPEKKDEKVVTSPEGKASTKDKPEGPPKPKDAVLDEQIEGGKGSSKKPEKTKKAFAMAQHFIATKAQMTSGLSGSNGRVVAASFCGLALLAGGSTPGKGPYSGALNKIMNLVLAQITADSGRQPGRGGANWNQENWKLGIGGMFLGEIYAVYRDPKVKAKLQEVVLKLEANQEDSGGYAHGPGGPNALGYLELEIMSNYACATLGMAKEHGCKVNEKLLEKALLYIEKCGRGGGINYSTRANQMGTGQPGRTGGAMLAYHCCKQRAHPLFKKMGAYMDRTIKEVPFGHASTALSFVGGAWGAILTSRELWEKYVTLHFPKILEHQQEDGSFTSIINPKEIDKVGDSDKKVGTAFNTGVYALILGLDEGRLRYMSGVYKRKKGSGGKSGSGGGSIFGN